MGPDETLGQRGQSMHSAAAQGDYWNRAMHCHADASLQGAAMQLTTLIGINQVTTSKPKDNRQRFRAQKRHSSLYPIYLDILC